MVADHLDLDFMYDRGEGDPDTERRDNRLNAAVANTGWPLVQQHHAVLPAPASMLLMSHNLFHRGARRLDTPEEQKELPRFMFRFMLFRTTDPEPPDMTEAPTMTAEESHEAWTQTTDHMTGPLPLFLLPSLSWGSSLRALGSNVFPTKKLSLESSEENRKRVFLS